ncbi:MAG: L-type lectin-domain containing protein [Planctomycetota bacterium]|nr:L-type lectin-domain containing protein [Planctomycetota bacterium]
MQRLSVLALALSPYAAAQGFDYPDFSSVAGLALNGDAVQAGTALRVSGASISEKGSAYYDQAVSVAAGFETTFTFSITAPTAGGGDGFALLIQNDPVAGLTALADHASAIGYSGFLATPTNAIDNAIAVEFDTYAAGSWGDPSANHISVHTGGTGDCNAHEDFSLGSVTPAIDMSDGAVHTVKVAYDGANLVVYLDDLVTPALSVPWDFATGGTYAGGGAVGGLVLQGGTSAYVGFTASAGGAWENHDVHSWSFGYAGTSIGTNYCGPANGNSSGMPAVISAFGSDVAADDSVRLDAAQMPTNQFGYFINSMNQGFVIPPGSQGILCVSGQIGRHSANVLSTGATGEFSLQLDLTDLPTPGGFYIVQPGETWYWQAWFRDVNPNQTNNFTEGICISFN